MVGIERRAITNEQLESLLELDESHYVDLKAIEILPAAYTRGAKFDGWRDDPNLETSGAPA